MNDMDFYTADSEIFLKTRELEEQGELNVRVFASLDAKQATDESIRQAKGYMTSDMEDKIGSLEQEKCIILSLTVNKNGNRCKSYGYLATAIFSLSRTIVIYSLCFFYH